MTDTSCQGESQRNEKVRATVNRLGLITLVLMLVLIPSGTATYLVFKYQTQLVEAPQQVWAEIPEAQTSVRSQLGLQLTWVSPQPLLAPEWSGIVQTVSVAPGSEISNGTEIARINGIKRLAMLTTEPLFRPLSFSAQGSDVAALNAFLKSQGLPANDSDFFGGASAKGVSVYAESIGVSPTTDTFDPGWVIFFNERVIADSVALTAGAPAPTAGEKLVTAAPHLQNVSFISALSANRLLEADPNTPLPRADPLTLDEGSIVSVGETALQIAEGSSELTPESVQKLAPQLRSLSPATLAMLDEQLPTAAWTLPASSIFVSQAGETCVVTLVKGEPYSTSVTVLRTTESNVLVNGPFKPGTRVALNPKIESMTCI